MIPSSTPSKILIAISLDQHDSNELISWTIGVLARPGDHIVAVHVIVEQERRKKGGSGRGDRRQPQIRQAKAHVISVLGEFASICLSKQINLEARVGFSSAQGRGLVEEAKSIAADYIVLHRPRNRSDRNRVGVKSYCFEHAPERCSVVSIGRCEQQPSQNGAANFSNEDHLSSRCREACPDPMNKDQTIDVQASPRTVLDELEGVDRESHTTEDDDTFSYSDLSTTNSSPSFLSISCEKAKPRKRLSPYKLISALFPSPLRRQSGRFTEYTQIKQPIVKCFSFEELASATNDFHSDNIVGRGGYSEVYKGVLPDGRMVAVKMLARDNNSTNKEKEFLMELGIISHVCHPNTANLVGYCVESGLYLIFKYSQNGNLSSALHGGGGTTKVLRWPERYKIAVGIARGLHYLHKSCKHRIIHRDIKASNVLLGPDYDPQISDFGLAKWLPSKWTHHAVIPIEGTFGYLAPEYFMHGIVNEKTDVYALGVLLLEIVSGRRPVDSSKQNLLIWAKPLMESGNITELSDPILGGEFEEDEMHRMVLTASYCVRQSPNWRPCMSEVLELLTSSSESEVARSWRMPKFTSDELDDYSMAFGYEVSVDVAPEDSL